MNTTIVLRIDGELKEKLKALAKKDRRSLSDWVRLELEKIVAVANSKERIRNAAATKV